MMTIQMSIKKSFNSSNVKKKKKKFFKITKCPDKKTKFPLAVHILINLYEIYNTTTIVVKNLVDNLMI